MIAAATISEADGPAATTATVSRNDEDITGALITLDLQTGDVQRDPTLYDFWIHSKTCAVPTASATGLYFRRDSCYMFDLPSRRTVPLLEGS